MATEWENKVVLITGSSSGIGAATALEFSRLGAKVVVHGRNAKRVNEVKAECEKLAKDKSKIFSVLGDIIIESDVRRIFKETIDHFGDIHVLVNNAGYGDCMLVETLPLELADAIYKMHFRAPLLLSQLSLPYLKKNKGCIVNVQSLSAVVGTHMTNAYQAMKSALASLTASLGRDWISYGIRVVGVSPGWVKTNIFQTSHVVENPEDADAIWESLAPYQPGKRIGTPDEIAKVIRFVASEDASYLNAQSITVDGGTANVLYGSEPMRLMAESMKEKLSAAKEEVK